jgi:hypothetical protein
MKVLILQDELFDYIKHIVRTYAAGGINPEEGLAIYNVHQAIKGAQSVDENHVTKVATGEVAGIPVASVAVTKDDKPYLPADNDPLDIRKP